jgi:pycsar effector protein
VEALNRQPSQSEKTHSRGIDFGWRTHSAITDWTAKVDSKASIVLSLGGVLLGFCITLSTDQRILSGLRGWHVWGERIGLGLVELGVVLAALVVMPRLYRRTSKRIWHQNFIYFGHLRHWNPDELKQQLAVLDSDRELKLLATQLVNTSKIAWFKHSCLQGSMISLALGVAVLAIAVW